MLRQAFIYYAPTLFRSLGQTNEMSLILSGVFNVLQIVGVLFAFLLIDRIGRRPLAIGGGLGNMTCYIVIAALAGTYEGRWASNASAGWACVAMAFLFIIIFGASYSPLGWALPSEVFPVSIRSKGVAFSGECKLSPNVVSITLLTLASIHQLAHEFRRVSLVVLHHENCIQKLTLHYSGIATPPMFDENTGIGFGTYIFFGFWCGLSAIWAYFLVPEVSDNCTRDSQRAKLT